LGGREGGLEAVEAPEVPGGVDDFVEEGLFEDAARAEFGGVGRQQFLKFRPFFGGDDDVASGEAVLEGVFGAAGFALGGPGTSGPGVGCWVLGDGREVRGEQRW
jgi:hypothetical protein